MKLAITMICAALLAGGCGAAKAPPDFTGVWTSASAELGSTARSTAAAPSLKPGAQARVDAYQRLVAPTGEQPGAWCLGTGMPGSMLGSGGYPMEIIQRPDQITIIYEAHSEMRHIYFGKRNAAQADRIPGRDGYSSGRWEGDVLVVETDNLVDQVDQRYAHSAMATIVERYHLDEADEQGRRVLVADLVMTDPDFYPAPVVQQKRWAQVPNGRLLPYECAEENWEKHLEELATKAGVSPP